MSHGINAPREQFRKGSMPLGSMPHEINAPRIKPHGNESPCMGHNPLIFYNYLLFHYLND